MSVRAVIPNVPPSTGGVQFYTDIAFDAAMDEIATRDPDDRLSVFDSPSHHLRNVAAHIPAAAPARHVEPDAPGSSHDTPPRHPPARRPS